MPLASTQCPSLLLFCLLLSVHLLSAQNPTDLHRHDLQIARCLEQGARDSFEYYVQQKCRLAQQSDSLELWAWERFDAYEAFEISTEKALQELDNALQQRWREPGNAQEWLPFLYIQSARGWCLYESGKIWKSMQAYEIALQIYERYRYPDFDAIENIYKPLGTHYTRLGDDDKAIVLFQKALAIGGDNERISGLYCNIGIAFWNKGDLKTSQAQYAKGLSLSGISVLKRALLWGALAQTQLDDGQHEKAAATAAQSLALLNRIKSTKATLEYRFYSRRTAGIAKGRLGQYKEAEQLLTAALKDALVVFGFNAREVGKIEVQRSSLYLRQGLFSLALDAANRALSAVIPGFKATKANTQTSNPQPSQFYQENTIFEALNAKAEAAKALYEQSGDTRWLELALECHDLAWQAEFMLRRVFQYNASKLHLQKDTRAREEAAMDIAWLLFEKTGQTAWIERAFTIAERSKAALLLDALQNNLVQQGLLSSDKRFETLTALRQNLSFFEKKFVLDPSNKNVAQWRIEADDLQGQIAALEQNLRKDYPNLLGFEAQRANWLPLDSDFSEGETLIEYFMSKAWVDIFVFQKDHLERWYRIPNDSELQDLIQHFLACFENDYTILNAPALYLQTAHALWQKLIPFESGASSMLSILPDGILNFVPFEALITDLNGTTDLQNAPYLLRKQSVRYAFSLAVLRQQKKLKSGASKYLLSIAPGFKNSERGLSPLAESHFNWQGIPGWDIQKLSGQNADLQHFMNNASDYRVLHFSTHAFAGDNPRIELTDSALLLPDLYGLSLKADLVLLNACETGLGKAEKGEGVMSLARAFAQSGAACIVSSLWSVNDIGTERLSGYFYDQISKGHSTCTALREAKLAYLADPEVGTAAQSPYFWAGLIVVGDDRVVPQPWGLKAWGLILIGVMVLIWGARRYWPKTAA